MMIKQNSQRIVFLAPQRLLEYFYLIILYILKIISLNHRLSNGQLPNKQSIF